MHQTQKWPINKQLNVFAGTISTISVFSLSCAECSIFGCLHIRTFLRGLDLYEIVYFCVLDELAIWVV